MKLHLIMDMTAPPHEGLQVWEDPGNSPKAGVRGLFHLLAEWDISRARERAAVRFMRLFYRDYKDQRVRKFVEYQQIWQDHLAEEEEAERRIYEWHEWK